MTKERAIAKKEIVDLNNNCDVDKKTIGDLRAQMDDMVEEVQSLSTSKALFMEMSGITFIFDKKSLLFFDRIETS